MSDDYPIAVEADVEEFIRGELRSGEELLTAHEWNIGEPEKIVGGLAAKVDRRTLAVTQERFYTFNIRHRLFSRRLVPVGRQDVALAQLSSISDTFDDEILERDRLYLDLIWNDGRRDHLFTWDVASGNQFVELLRDAHDRCGVLGAGGAATVADQLAKLGELKGQGLLSDADWQRAKELFLGKPRSKQQEAITNLRQLHGLFQSGVLSESEFNLKKWDVLSRS